MDSSAYSRCRRSATADWFMEAHMRGLSVRWTSSIGNSPVTGRTGSRYVQSPSAADWTFAGSDEGGRRAAAIYTLIATAKLNDIDPQAWLAEVLAACPITRRHQLFGDDIGLPGQEHRARVLLGL